MSLKRVLLLPALFFAVYLAISLALNDDGPLWRKLLGPVLGGVLAALIAVAIERRHGRRA